MTTRRKRILFAIIAAIVLMTTMVVYGAFAWFGERDFNDNTTLGQSASISGEAAVGQFLVTSEQKNGATTLFDADILFPGESAATAHPVYYTNNGTRLITLLPKLSFNVNGKAYEYFVGIEKIDIHGNTIHKESQWYSLATTDPAEVFNSFNLSFLPKEQWAITINIRLNGEYTTNEYQGTKIGADLLMYYK